MAEYSAAPAGEHHQASVSSCIVEALGEDHGVSSCQVSRHPHPLQVERNIDATDANTTLLQLEERHLFSTPNHKSLEAWHHQIE